METDNIYSMSFMPPDKEVHRNPAANMEAKSEKEIKLKKACADFEAIFIYYMFKTMRNTIPRSGMLNKITGKDTYEMMMDQKVSEELAKKGGFGLQTELFNQIETGK